MKLSVSRRTIRMTDDCKAALQEPKAQHQETVNIVET